MHTLVIVNPGHFHAGLILRRRHADLSRDVYIFSEAGTDLDNYMKLVNAFNERAEEPTDWIYHVYTGEDFLEKAVEAAEKKIVDIAVFAGRNDQKVYYLDAMHKAGCAILTDKPVTINSDGAAVLEKTVARGGKPIMDIMTGRQEPPARLLKDLMLSKEIFGEFRKGDEPMIENGTVHHLYKTVNGAPLVRPAWYFDVNKQGSGLCDVTTHLADNAQWMLFGDQDIDFDKDIKLIDATLTTTDVPADKFELITKTPAFPADLADCVENNVLKVACNGVMDVEIKGVSVRLHTVWNLEAPAGGGDMHHQIVRGTLADIFVEQGPDTEFKALVLVKPLTMSAEAMKSVIEKRLAELNYTDATVEVYKDGRLLVNPPSSMVDGHEFHFAIVRDEFLNMLATGKETGGLRTQLVSKYKLMAAARDLALKK